MSAARGATTTSLRGDFVVNLLGNIGYAAAQWVMLLVLVRLGSPAMVGEYSLGLAVGAPVLMFTNLRLASLVASDAARTRPFSDYFSLRLVSSGIALVVVALSATLAGYHADTWWVIAVVGMAKVAESFSDITNGYLILRLKFAGVATSLLVRGWGSVIVMIVLRLLNLPLLAVVSGVAIWWCVAFWLVDLRLLRAARVGDDSLSKPPPTFLGLLRAFRFDASLVRLAWHAIPLGIVALSLSLSASVPRLAIAKTLGSDAVGYFAALAYLMVAGRMIATALSGPMLPRLGQFVANGDARGLQRTMTVMIGFGFFLGIIGVVGSAAFGRPMLSLVYGAQYASFATVLTWLMVAAGLGYMATFVEDGLVAMRHLRAQGVILLVSLASVFAGAAILIPRYGLMGAAWTVCVGATVELVGAGALFAYALLTWQRQLAASGAPGVRGSGVTSATMP